MGGRRPYFREVVMFVFMEILAIAFNVQKQGSINGALLQNSQDNVSPIFGVRWRFGDGFNFDEDIRNSEYYSLEFNSQQSLNSDTYVRCGKAIFTCSESHHSIQNFSTFVYLCRINKNFHQPVSYSICKGNTHYVGQQNLTYIEPYNQTVLFHGLFRENNDEKSILMLGNLHIDENTSLSLVSNILEKQNISVLAFGNLLPYFNANNFESVLRFLEPITSSAVTIPIYQIRNSLQEFFYKITFPISTSVSPHSYNILSFQQLNFAIFLASENGSNSEQSKLLNKSFKSDDSFVLVLSSQSLNYITKSNLFQEIGMDIYLSPEINDQYETKQICWSNKYPMKNSDTKHCPYIINEGLTLNQKQEYGVFKIDNKKHITFTHYSESMALDHFELDYYKKVEQQSENTKQENIHIIRKVIIVFQYLLLFGLVGALLITLFTYLKSSKKQTKNQQNHVQLVEQIVANSQSPTQ